jgi:hypothetical protein
MRSLWKVLGVALPVAFLVACSEQASAPETNTPAVTANWMNNPDNGNPRFMRTDGSVWWISWDDGRYEAWHVSGPGGAGMNGAVCGRGPDWPYSTQSQMVWPGPADQDWWNSLSHSRDMGDLWVVILDTQTPGPCLGMAVAAQGAGSFRATYTDVLSGWWGLENGRPNSWVATFQSEGNLTTPTGKAVRYNGHLHLTLAADNTLKSATSQIILH